MKFFNSLTSEKEKFIPINENEVSLYVCGPTVYDTPHIGNMRPVIVFDCLKKFLEYLGYNVKYISNITDVDDKIINKALENSLTEKEISEKFIKIFIKNLKHFVSYITTKMQKLTENMYSII